MLLQLEMPVTTRSSTRPTATATATATAAPSAHAHAHAHAHTYNLRNERPSAGFYTELTAADVAAAETLVSMRSAPAPTRRSARIAQRS